jgi:hypothetical protein
MKNRKREICTSGSVRDEDGQPPHLLGSRTFLHLAAGAAVLPAVSRFAWAQVYPSRPVHVVVPFAAGGLAERHREAERLATMCREDAIRAGISVEDLEAAVGGDLVRNMRDALEAAKNRATRPPTEAAYRSRSAKSSAHWVAICRHCRASSTNCCLTSRSCT